MFAPSGKAFNVFVPVGLSSNFFSQGSRKNCLTALCLEQITLAYPRGGNNTIPWEVHKMKTRTKEVIHQMSLSLGDQTTTRWPVNDWSHAKNQYRDNADAWAWVKKNWQLWVKPNQGGAL